MNKTLKLLIRIFAIILGIFLLAMIGLNIYFRVNYADFYELSERGFKIPGLNEGFIPQGLTRCNDGTFLTCGYMKDGSASRIYIIDNNSYVSLKNLDGSVDTNHAGGLAVNGDYLYMTNEDYISVYLLDDVLTASAGNTITPIYFFYTGLDSAFVYVNDDKMYVGEFYREENYPTDESHHMNTDAGDMHHSIMAVFALSENSEYGFLSEIPEYVYSIDDLAQGVCITGRGNICLSTSYGTADSHIYIYDDPAQYSADGEFEIAGTRVPLYYLDSNHLQKTVTLFPMTEELFFADNKINIMCESASNKYIFGKLTGCSYVYSFSVS
ncbi:hypothetical protein SDC9_67772 [bioreactor metagenome]|uniref:DUF5050 domain-containing protein n=1 Tax=bioreactor metagenome TaxID=1076179 RepID=A0A644XZW5_9ZZZZ|nr:hypothetical protein [Candidatus Metalachnospira sp.]